MDKFGNAIDELQTAIENDDDDLLDKSVGGLCDAYNELIVHNELLLKFHMEKMGKYFGIRLHDRREKSV